MEHRDDAVTSLELKEEGRDIRSVGAREELEWKPMVMMMLIQCQVTVRFSLSGRLHLAKHCAGLVF